MMEQIGLPIVGFCRRLKQVKHLVRTSRRKTEGWSKQ
jgi:hypothetical protein